MVDLLMLDPEVYSYSQLALSLSCMYIVLSNRPSNPSAEASGKYTKEVIAEHFPHRSVYLLEDKTDEVNILFHNFLLYCTEMSVEDLLPTVQFAARYYSVKFNFESPSVLKSNIASILNVAVG